MHIQRPAGLVKLSFGLKWVQKTKTSIYEILRILFLSMDFSFAYFANFNISSVLKSPQNGQFHLQFSFGVFKRCSIQVGALFSFILLKKDVVCKLGKNHRMIPAGTATL